MDHTPFAPFDGLDLAPPRSLSEARVWIGRLARRLAPACLLAACFAVPERDRLRDTLLLNATYPSGWIGPYLVLRLDRVDPVFIAARRGLSFAWRGLDMHLSHASHADACRPDRASARTEELFRLAGAHGIAAGAVAAHMEPDRGCTVLAAAGHAEYPYERLVPPLLAMASQLHAGASALVQMQRAALPFTEQEMRVLHAMRMGLRDHEIAAALRTSVANIRMHLSRLHHRTGYNPPQALSLLQHWQPFTALDPMRVDGPTDDVPSPWQFTLFP